MSALRDQASTGPPTQATLTGPAVCTGALCVVHPYDTIGRAARFNLIDDDPAQPLLRNMS